jgi:streptogramin lyase
MSVSIVARLRAEWRTWKGQVFGGPPPRRGASRKLQVEVLEGRALLASTIEYPLASGSDPNQIVAGPDGNLWFTDLENSNIGVITTSGKVTVYPSGSPAIAITNGPDGALWFTQEDFIARITTSGKVTQFGVSPPWALKSGGL